VRLLLSVVGNAVALLATTIVPGIRFGGSWLTLLLAGAVFGLFNLIVRPVALLLSLPFLVLTLGLFYFVLNGILLWLAGKVVPGYDVSSVWAGMLGAIVLSLANWAFHAVFGPGEKK
jgi:putative membrane protein